MVADLHIDGLLTIPGDDLEFTAVRSSGPGGQHVNKTSSKVVLRFDVAGTTALSESMKARLYQLAASRFDGEGRLVVTSQDSRHQSRNLADARYKLSVLLRAAAHVPTRRVATRPSKRVVRRRLNDKRHLGDKKRLRRTPSHQD